MTSRAGLVDMRKSLVSGPPSDFQTAELASLDARIVAIEHETHSAKPLAQQRKALEARLARASACLAKGATEREEARGA